MIVLAVFLAALVSGVKSQLLDSPCPSVLEYGELLSDKWFAKVTFPPDRQRWSTIDIVLDRKTQDLGSVLGLVTTQDNLEFRITNQEPNENFTDSFEMFVTYDDSAGSPQVLQIKLDQQEICDINYKQKTQFRTKLLSTTPSEEINSEPDNGLAQCGIVKIRVYRRTSLSAAKIVEGQWPWHTAVYKIQGANIRYNCGGTLVSHRHVITGAHSLIVPRSKPTKTEVVKDYMVYLGAHNLALLANGVQINFVEKIIIHPEFDSKTLRKDLGILQLRDPVLYSNWVQPACLWPDLITDLDRIIGKRGTVIGWDDIDSGNLRLSQMNIVSQTDCLWSNPDIAKLTSNYTLCAGQANSTTMITCAGSLGNGLMLPINGAWTLRGVISIALATTNNGKVDCDPLQNFVFTDVAQFLPWIKNNM